MMSTMMAASAHLRPGRRPGRRPGFSVDDIAQAALAVGFDNLTMTAVAERLGVKHSSLYRRIRGRDELVTAAMDRAVRQVDWPRPDGDWRRYLERTADAIWNLFTTYPGMATQIRELPRTPPSVTRLFYATVVELTRHGFDDESAVLIVDTVVDLAADVYLGGERLSGDHAADDAVRLRLRESWAGEPSDASAARFAPIIAGIIEGDHREWFHRKLALVLDGAETRRKTR
ncbi:helix-turn-helix domain-containing protein [Thermopolyspora sp. NPDC052614]|uniref:TetR/AcrR family transcriptional regulator n=1 Tax=Thermopolyspora sp. NPDC052614 TaxID=3155682 RepID=UPI0034125AA3